MIEARAGIWLYLYDKLYIEQAAKSGNPTYHPLVRERYLEFMDLRISGSILALVFRKLCVCAKKAEIWSLISSSRVQK